MAEFVWTPLDEEDIDILIDPEAQFSAHLSVKKTLDIIEDDQELITSGELYDKANAILQLIRPYVKKDGGDVELVGIKNGWAQLRFLGNCNSCGAFSGTMIEIEESICEEVPEIKGVEVIQE